MKSALNGHVEQQRHVMFQRSADEVRNLLQRMVRTLQQTLDERADEIFLAMRRDYRAVLGGGDLPQGELLPKAQRLMRKAVMSKIESVEKIFRRVAGLEMEGENVDKEDKGENGSIGDGDSMGNLRPAESDKTDRKGYVSPYPTQSPYGQYSTSTTAATGDPQTSHPITKDVPMADAPVAITDAHTEAREPARTDAVPVANAAADPAVTQWLNTVRSTSPTGTSKTTNAAPQNPRKEGDRQTDSEVSTDDDREPAGYGHFRGRWREDYSTESEEEDSSD